MPKEALTGIQEGVLGEGKTMLCNKGKNQVSETFDAAKKTFAKSLKTF